MVPLIREQQHCREDLPRKFSTRGRNQPRLLGNGRGDRLRTALRNLRRTRGAATEAEELPRRWPGLAPVPKEKLLAMEVKFLDVGVFRRPRSQNTAAGHPEGRRPRKEAQLWRNPRCHPRAGRPKLMRIVLGRKLEEACRWERKAPLLSQLRTF